MLPSTGRDHRMLSKDLLVETSHRSHPLKENISLFSVCSQDTILIWMQILYSRHCDLLNVVLHPAHRGPDQKASGGFSKVKEKLS